MHANTPADVPARLEALGMLGGLPRPALHAQVAAALQVLVQVRRDSGGRALESVCLLTQSWPDGVVTVVPAWTRVGGLGPAGPALARLIARRGAPVPPVLTPAEPAAASGGRSAVRAGGRSGGHVGSAAGRRTGFQQGDAATWGDTSPVSGGGR